MLTPFLRGVIVGGFSFGLGYFITFLVISYRAKDNLANLVRQSSLRIGLKCALGGTILAGIVAILTSIFT